MNADDRKGDGRALLDKLASLQQDDGHLVGTNGSITRSGGVSLKMETTALAALAWMNDSKWTANANHAIEWIGNNRQGSGGFGSTQATILALRALVEFAKAHRDAMHDGALVLSHNGEEISRTEFDSGQMKAIELTVNPDELTPGDNGLTIGLTGENKMPYVLDVNYRTEKPVSANECAMRIETSLSATTVESGDTARAKVQIWNVTGEGQPMTTAIVGLPAGLEPRTEQLKVLQESGKFDYYEIIGRELVFYWRSISPKIDAENRIEFELELVAEIPGEYTAPASRVYLYYTSEFKHWTDPLHVEITHD